MELAGPEAARGESVRGRGVSVKTSDSTAPCVDYKPGTLGLHYVSKKYFSFFSNKLI